MTAPGTFVSREIKPPTMKRSGALWDALLHGARESMNVKTTLVEIRSTVLQIRDIASTVLNNRRVALDFHDIFGRKKFKY